MSNFSSISQLQQSFSKASSGMSAALQEQKRMPWERGRQDKPQRRGESRYTPKKFSEDEINRSVNCVERAVENFTALHENFNYYKLMTMELTHAFDEEKRQVDVLSQKLAESEVKVQEQVERTAHVEKCLTKASTTVSELEQELATLQARFDRLLQSTNRLAAIDLGPTNWEEEMNQLLAA